MNKFLNKLSEISNTTIYKVGVGKYQVEVRDENFHLYAYAKKDDKVTRVDLDKIGIFYSDEMNKFYTDGSTTDVSRGDLNDIVISAAMEAEEEEADKKKVENKDCVASDPESLAYDAKEEAIGEASEEFLKSNEEFIVEMVESELKHRNLSLDDAIREAQKAGASDAESISRYIGEKIAPTGEWLEMEMSDGLDTGHYTYLNSYDLASAIEGQVESNLAEL